MLAGKGDKRRQKQVPDKDFNDEWDRLFPKKK